MQLFDKSVFGPFKLYFDDAAELVKPAFVKASIVQNSDRWEYYLFDRNIFTDSDFLPSHLY